MPNIASVFKSEIARIARKEVRGETQGLKKVASTHRAEIAALKRRTQDLERELRRLSKASVQPAASSEEKPAIALRFSAKSLASQRRRLGLSASDCGLLVGASAQSIYNREEGGTRPLARHASSIAALRSMGKKEAATRLQSLKAT